MASLVMVAVLPSSQSNLTANSLSVTKMNSIFTTLRAYQAANGYLPCPADPAYGITYNTNPYYGAQAANGGATQNCTGSTPAANFVDSTNHVAIGMVPVRTLGLPNSYALDAYGRDITYAVDTNATSCWPSATLPGAITVADNGGYYNTVAALISHGADGHGAYLPNTGSGTTLTRMNAGSTDTDQLVNAHITTGTFPTAAASSFLAWSGNVTASATFVSKAATGTFDDLVVYKSPQWNINATPAGFSANAPIVTPPANGTYTTSQYITLTVTFPSAVTVTTGGGTPYIALGALGYGGAGIGIGTSNVAQATYYAAGSTSTALQFRYQVQSSDYAPNGIYMATNITLNGGTISGCPLNYTAPNMSGVIIKASVTLYVADENNQRIQKCTSAGVCSAFGSSGSGNGQVSYPLGVAVDGSGNVWVADSSNARVDEFNSSGSPLLNFSGGTKNYFTNANFVVPSGIAVDGSGNLWITDKTPTNY